MHSPPPCQDIAVGPSVKAASYCNMIPNLARAGFTLSPAVGAALSLSTIVVALIAQLLRHIKQDSPTSYTTR